MPGEDIEVPGELKKLTLQELMDLEVTTVSKSVEKLSEAPSAIQVITGNDIRRSGASRLPEALRLANNLYVSQLNAHSWGITARGFTGAPTGTTGLANKLLVMVDGRSIYTPLFGGVFWDVQHVPLEDIDRIEVVSGPGGTLWGANAVNGVINIVTRSAQETQGVGVTAAAGSFLQDLLTARYGGTVGENLFYRVYAHRYDHDNTELMSGLAANDAWHSTQGGFRMDYAPSDTSTLTVQGDYYNGAQGTPRLTEFDGGNLLGRWTRTFSQESALTVQVYFDRSWRETATFEEVLETVDLDLQQRSLLGTRHSVLWGAGYRVMDDEVQNSASLSFLPANRTMPLFSAFLQDEITLAPANLKLTMGAKLEHNDFSGFEIQPSARIAWIPTDRHMAWAAVSRAVRSPSRFDADLVSPALRGDPDFDAEALVAYEVGTRLQPMDTLSVSLAAFYHDYDRVRSINQNTPPPPLFVFANDQTAESWGIELSGTLQAAPWWLVRGGYMHLSKDFDARNERVFPGSAAFEGSDPESKLLVRSIMDLPGDTQLDLMGRFIASVPSSELSPGVPAYFSFDTRIARRFRRWEISLVGQNLADDRHPESGSPASWREIPRSAYGTVRFDW